jgi:ABC-type glutathione transport system ATPase component
MQMVFQDPLGSLDARLTLGDQVARPLRNFAVVPRAAEQAEVARLFDRVHLPRALMGRYPHEVSGGQRQRAAIARALAPRPGLIVADEAVASLDMTLKTAILRLFAELQADLGLALLFISHDLGAVAHLSHDIVVMYRGRIVEQGPRDAVLGDPQHAHTRALLAARAGHFGLAPRRSNDP